MLSFFGDPNVKAKHLARVKAHREAGNLIKEIGWGNGKGCAVGCTLNAYDHSLYHTKIGLPEWIAHLEDAIFENLPNALAMTWPERLLDAIIVGVDVEPVRWRLAIWRHTKQLDRLEGTYSLYAVKCRQALSLAIECCKAELDGKETKLMWVEADGLACAAEWTSRKAAYSIPWFSRSSSRGNNPEVGAAVWAAELEEALSSKSSRGSMKPFIAYFIKESQQLLKLLMECK